tara:strand:+ start:66926 stop:67771 length:846 start_codon:yes stop_codon:yes gene_type:complete
MFFEKSDKGYVCTLCPHLCDIEIGQAGFCKVRNANDDGVYLDAYGKLTHIAVEPIEKKPIKHFLKGTKTLSIGSYSCNMVCGFCENSAYSQDDRSEKAKSYSAEDVVKLAFEKKCASVCMTYNEPTIYYEYLLDIAAECKKYDVKFLLKTNAYLNEEPWAKVCRFTDAMNVDFKGMGKSSRRVTGVENAGIFDRIREAYEAGVHIEISIPVYHGIFDGGGFHELGEVLHELSPDIPIHLLKIYPANRHMRYPTTSNRDMSDIFEILSTYSNQVSFFEGVSI